MVAPFYKKVTACRKKGTDDPRKESITEEPFEESITEHSKRTLSLRTIKRTLSLRNLKKDLSPRNLKRTLRILKTLMSLRYLRGFRTLNNFCAAKILFWLFGCSILIEWVIGKSFHLRTLALEGLIFAPQ